MTSPTSAGSSATPVASRSRLHWSVVAPLTAATGVGAAVFGALADLPVLGLAGAMVAAVPAVLAAWHVPALQSEVARHRGEAARHRADAATASTATEAPTTEAPTTEAPTTEAPTTEAPTTAPTTVDLTGIEREPTAAPTPPAQPVVDLVKAAVPAVDLVKPTVPVQTPAPATTPEHATVGRARTPMAGQTGLAARSDARDETHARVDTAELQLIWDLGEAARSRSGHGRRARMGAEVDALPDRPRNPASPRRRARHRA